MRRKFASTILMLVAIGLACLQPLAAFAQQSQTLAPPVAIGGPAHAFVEPGNYTYKLVHDGMVRMYRVYVPTSWQQVAGPAPVLFAFHGGGGNMNYQAENYGLIPKAEQEGFIAVFPNGYSTHPDGTFATWNAGNCCAAAQKANSDDAGFVRQIVDDLSRKINIDRNRLYATGMSNGGMMTYRLACELSDVFKAIASVAGTDNTLTCSPSRPVSVVHFHALDDTHVPFYGGKGPDSRVDTVFVSVPATISKWVALNSCNATPKRVFQNAGAYCDLYTSCQNGSEVQLCVTQTGGHSWPGNPPKPGHEPPSQAINADNAMWDFFQQLERRQ